MGRSWATQSGQKLARSCIPQTQSWSTLATGAGWTATSPTTSRRGSIDHRRWDLPRSLETAWCHVAYDSRSMYQDRPACTDRSACDDQSAYKDKSAFTDRRACDDRSAYQDRSACDNRPGGLLAVVDNRCGWLKGLGVLGAGHAWCRIWNTRRHVVCGMSGVRAGNRGSSLRAAVTY